MTAYIPNLKAKRRQWDGGKVWNTSATVRQQIESLPSFKKVQAEMNAGVAEVQDRLREERDGDARKQRWKTRTSEEKARECIDALTSKIKNHGEMGVGTAKTHEEARAKAVEVAERFDREKSGE